MLWGLAVACLGIVLMVIEAFTSDRQSSRSLWLGAAGSALVIGGGAGLVFSDHLWLAVAGGFLLFTMLCAWVIAMLEQVSTDFSNLAENANAQPVQWTAEVVENIEPGTSEGKVLIEGQIWNATADAPIQKGSMVSVDTIDEGVAVVSCCA